MAKNPICKEEGCTTTSWKGGYYWKHHPENLWKKGLVKNLEKPVAPVAPVEIEELEEAAVIESYPDPPVKTESTPEPDPPVTDHEVHIVNLIDVFKQKQAAELAAFTEKIGSFTDPYEKMMFTLKAVQI